jgi:hypothetical protein
MTKIFISYRREDSAYIAEMIRERLCHNFGPDSVFIDVENIPIGADYRNHIGRKIESSNVLLALIGERWLGKSVEGVQRRIDNPEDPVRLELEKAIECGIVIVPVLVGNARMPSMERLPDSLRSLVYRQAAEVRSGRSLTSDLETLMRGLKMILDSNYSASGKVNSDWQVITSRQESPSSSITHAITRTVPNRSIIGIFRGIWCVFRLDGHKFALWMSMLTGKEELYVDDKLVNPATRKIFSLSHTHTIRMENTEYAIQVTVQSFTKGIIACTLLRAGEPMLGFATEYKRPRYKKWLIYLVDIVVGIVGGLLWVYSDLPLLLISSVATVFFLFRAVYLFTGSRRADGYVIREFQPSSDDLHIEASQGAALDRR